MTAMDNSVQYGYGLFYSVSDFFHVLRFRFYASEFQISETGDGQQMPHIDIAFAQFEPYFCRISHLLSLIFFSLLVEENSHSIV